MLLYTFLIIVVGLPASAMESLGLRPVLTYLLAIRNDPGGLAWAIAERAFFPLLAICSVNRLVCRGRLRKAVAITLCLAWIWTCLYWLTDVLLTEPLSPAEVTACFAYFILGSSAIGILGFIHPRRPPFPNHTPLSA